MKTKTQNILSCMAFVLIIVFPAGHVAGWAQTTPLVKTDKEIYTAGVPVRVFFEGAPGSNHDWICIVTATAPDNEAGDYQYLPAAISRGELIFVAPSPGKYEVRAYYHYSSKGYIVSARQSFSVADQVSAALTDTPKILKPEIDRMAAPSAENAVPANIRRHDVAIFFFTPLNVEATGYGVTATNILANNPKMQAAFSVLNRKDLEIFLSGNNLQQNDRLDNILDIGARLGLNFVIAGNMEKRGATILTSCIVVNIARKMIIFRKKFQAGSEADLADKMSKLSDEIIKAILHSP